MTFDGTNLFVVHITGDALYDPRRNAATPSITRQGQHLQEEGKDPTENVVQGTADDPVYDGTLPTTIKEKKREEKPTIL